MELRDVLQCNKDLLALLRPRPAGALPSQAWEDSLIYLGTGAQAINHLGLSNEEKLSQLKELYPDLGVFEYLRLNQRLSVSANIIATHLHFPVKDDNAVFFEQVLNLPCILQDHLDQRKVKLSELTFLRGWKIEQTTSLPNEWIEVFKKIASLNLSLQVSLKSLEILIDLFLMEKSVSHLLTAKTELEWTTGLFQLRFPVSHQIQVRREEQMSEIRWPAFAKAKVTRRGDRTGFEVQAFIASDADLTKMMATLERVKDQFQQSKEKSES